MSQPKFRGDFACGILAKVNAIGRVEILVLGVIPKHTAEILRKKGKQPEVDDLDIKLPGGCADTPDATSGEVLLDEIRQECFQGKCTLGPLLLVLERRKRNRDKLNGPDHIQRFFLVTIWEGDLRKTDLLEDEGDEYLSPPVFVEFRELHDKVYGTHQEPIFKAVEVLARKDKLIADEYADLLADFQAGIIKPKFQKKKKYA